MESNPLPHTDEPHADTPLTSASYTDMPQDPIQSQQQTQYTAQPQQQPQQPQQSPYNGYNQPQYNYGYNPTQPVRKQESAVPSVLACLMCFLFFLPLVSQKDYPFSKHYANFSLNMLILIFVLTLFNVLVYIIGLVLLFFMPATALIILTIMNILPLLMSAGIFAIEIVAVVNAVNRKCIEIPLLTKIKFFK